MNRSRWSKFFGVVPVVVALAGLAGCDKPAVGDESTDVASDELVAEPAPAGQAKEMKARGDHHRKPHGPAMLLGAALHELELSDAQKTTIQGELDALHDMAGPRPEHDAARKELAAAVKSGRVDEAALLAKAAPPKPDMTRVAKAIGVLHDTLTAAQRKELVAAVQDRMEHMGPRGDRGPGKARAGDDQERGAREGKEGAREHGMHGPLGHMLRGLSLSDAQREQVKNALSMLAPSEADREAMKAQHEAFRTKMQERLASFANDSFDANAFVAPPDGEMKGGPEKMFGHMVKALAVVVPILDDTQRAELAKRIEEGPGAHPGMEKPWKGKGRGRAE